MPEVSDKYTSHLALELQNFKLVSMVINGVIVLFNLLSKCT